MSTPANPFAQPPAHPAMPAPIAGPAPRRRLGLIVGAVTVSAAVATAGVLLLTRDESGAEAVAGDQPASTGDVSRAAEVVDATSNGLVTDLSGVERATIRVEAAGERRYREEGFGEGFVFGQQSSWSGSGFIIDQSGLAVTNHHVVAGAASITVFIGNDDTEYNARILGVDQCSDLAVLDIEGDGFSHLAWYDGEIEPGLEITTAGFPLGDPEFTMTRGIVTKGDAGGETYWASIERVLEHDANTQPGNSGGPLLTENAEVVGVHYRGNSVTNTSQMFAISSDIARPIVEHLATGIDGDTIGIDGDVFVDDETGLFGMWVTSVASGSPAAEAGVRAGDIITQLEGQNIGSDGTMAGYCDVLRTQGADQPIGIEVLRRDTSEVLEGELNGRPLETTVYFG